MIKDNSPASTRVPTLSTDKVASVAPLNLVSAPLAHAVLRVATAVGPPAVEVPIVLALAVPGDLAGLENFGHVAIITVRQLVEEVEGATQHGGGGRGREKESLEGDHGWFLTHGGNEMNRICVYLADLVV